MKKTILADFLICISVPLTAFKLPRCHFYDIMTRDYVVSYELHRFSDASQKAYGCLLYLKCVTKNNFIFTLLVA